MGTRERHKKLSYIKSVIRIAGLATLYYLFSLGLLLLIMAEIIGILEETDE